MKLPVISGKEFVKRLKKIDADITVDEFINLKQPESMAEKMQYAQIAALN